MTEEKSEEEFVQPKKWQRPKRKTKATTCATFQGMEEKL